MNLRRLRRPRHEAGSAYILALLFLVILTMMGLSLSVISSTEMQVGANERLKERVFYAADAGITVLAQLILVDHDYTERSFEMNTNLPYALTSNQVRVGPIGQLSSSPSNYSNIAAGGQYGSKPQFLRVLWAVPSIAERESLQGTSAVERVLAVLDSQPIKAEGLDALFETEDEDIDRLAEIFAPESNSGSIVY